MKKLKRRAIGLVNVNKLRFGFATNSSSSHSMVFGESILKEDQYDDCGYSFNWENFLIQSKKGKQIYLLSQIKDAIDLYRHHNEKSSSFMTINGAKLKKWAIEEFNKVSEIYDDLSFITFSEPMDIIECNKISPVDGFDRLLDRGGKEELSKLWIMVDYVDGYNSKNAVEEWAYGSSVDHQSVVTLPMDIDGDFNIDYVKEWYEYFSNAEVVFIGGNDNSESSDEFEIDEANAVPEYLQKAYSPYSTSSTVAYKNGNYWVLIDRIDGFKQQIAFNNDPSFEFKAAFPELIDMKITDYCDIGCTFCYQDSTPDGVHCGVDNVENLAKRLYNAGVCCEFALGGGEPTRHPKFPEILDIIKKYGHIVNFTTNDIVGITSNPLLMESIKNNVSAIGLSISSNKTIDDLVVKTAIKLSENLGVKIVYHTIPDMYESEDIFVDFIKELYSKIVRYDGHKYLSILMLGYKSTGRGDDHVDLISFQEIKKQFSDSNHLSGINISIDTKYASDHLEELNKLKIQKYLYYIEEGKISSYYDAVVGKFHKSSYHINDEGYELKDSFS